MEYKIIRIYDKNLYHLNCYNHILKITFKNKTYVYVIRYYKHGIFLSINAITKPEIFHSLKEIKSQILKDILDDN